MEPLPGAREFLAWLRERFQVVILSDTFYQFAEPLMRQLGEPDAVLPRPRDRRRGRVVGYRLRMPDEKRCAVQALRGLSFATIAAGDSYNDTAMLAEADAGILFRPPDNVVRGVPAVPGDAQLRRAARRLRARGGVPLAARVPDAVHLEQTQIGAAGR